MSILVQDDLNDIILNEHHQIEEEKYSFEEILRGSITTKIHGVDFLNPLDDEELK